MVIETKFFGEISLENEKVITFPEAIYGFEEFDKYVLINFDENDGSLMCMQSIDQKNLAFILLNPFDIDEKYNPLVEDLDLEVIGAKENDGLFFYVIATIKEDAQITVNLKSPIIINPTNCWAKQIILTSGEYTMRHPVVFDKN